MTRLVDLPTPSLILDLDVLEANLDRMMRRVSELGAALRPHAKTHKCPQIAAMQLQRGASGLTVSTLDEARAFADADCDDLLWAFPIIPSRLEEIADLAERTTLRLLVDTPEAIDALEDVARRRELRLRVRVEVDCGDHRSGVDPRSERLVELARRLRASQHLDFDGLLTHGGHSYHEPGRDALRRVADQERDVMVDAAERLKAEGLDVPCVSLGSTPSTTAAEDLSGIDEARPGNYCFYDLTQAALGACEQKDIAVSVLTTVVSAQPGAEHCVIDAGALSLSKDPGPAWTTPPNFGVAVGPDLKDRTPRARVRGLSQEHGVLDRPLRVGEKVRVLPNHSCLVVPHFARYAVVRGSEVVDFWTITPSSR